MSILDIVGKKIVGVVPNFNKLSVLFDDNSRLILNVEGRVVPKMMYKLYIEELYSGEVDEVDWDKRNKK
ncbi:MAG: hypothetical protein GX957_09570 [Clostridiaceae bacterium]|nr:hypothetical protein [Clostridiaceae bacterium]